MSHEVCVYNILARTVFCEGFSCTSILIVQKYVICLCFGMRFCSLTCNKCHLFVLLIMLRLSLFSHYTAWPLAAIMNLHQLILGYAYCDD
jgi:hypothetical protein